MADLEKHFYTLRGKTRQVSMHTYCFLGLQELSLEGRQDAACR